MPFITTKEISAVLADAFRECPPEPWWTALELPGDLIVWAAVKRDELRPRRLQRLRVARENLEILAGVPVVIHVLAEPNPAGAIVQDAKRLARRW